MSAKRESMIKKWYQLARPHKGRWFWQFVTALTADMFHIVEPIFAANVITSLTVGDWNAAYMWLAFAFAGILVRNIFWDINYRMYGKLIGHTYLNIQSQMYRKIIMAKDKNFKTTSREKLLNIVGTDVANVSHLTDVFCTKFSRLLRIGITIIIVFSYSATVGALIIVISIINYFILNWINTKVAREQKNLAEANESLYEKLNEVVAGRSLIKDFNLDVNMEKEYRARGERWVKAKHKQTVWQSGRIQWHFVFWNLMVALVSIYLVYQVSNGLSLTVYLMLVPYFVSSMEKLTDFSNITTDIKNADVSVNRINIILNFEDNETVKFGGLESLLSYGDIAFNNVSLKDTSDIDGGESRLTDVSFHIKKGAVALFCGSRNCGKRAIFYLLRRTLTPASGTVLLSGINVYDFSRADYKKKVNYTSAKPFFFDGSILKNFQNVEGDIEEIYKINTLLGLHNFIEKLPQGYNTDLNKNLDKIPQEKRFLIGLSCALLSGAGVVMIYEFPPYFSASDYKKLKAAFSKLAESRTIIIFSANERLADLCSEVYNIEDGRVEEPKEGGNKTAGGLSLSRALEDSPAVVNKPNVKDASPGREESITAPVGNSDQDK